MKSGGLVRLAFVLLTVTWASSMPAKESTTRRPSQPQIGDTIKQLTSQLMNVNSTSSDITLDTRTPPKVKQQLKKLPPKEVKLENSHPGIAVAVDESDLLLEENTKKFNFYKIDNKPTTDRGLSTWVLLNSQTVSPPSSTTKSSRKPAIKLKLEESKNSTTVAEIFNKITKPLFKKRPLPTTTKKPTTISIKTSTVAEKEYKLTKVKASILSNAINSKNKTEVNHPNKKSNASISSDSKKENPSETGNMQEISTIKPNNKMSTTVSIKYNELIPLEAKDGEIELIATTPSSKKTRRPTTTKRKKNKKRRRPSIDKSDTNSTKIANKLKEKPISTQIYNYLSREIIPTVGVGLVGLMVTAGLASYFLYPFGVARRSYEVDRKDKEGSYYYSDEHAPDGIAEEEVIGKVIAGMPANSNHYQSYRSPTSRDAYSNSRYKQNDYELRKAQPQASVEAIYLTPTGNYGEDEDTYVAHRNHKQEFYNPQSNYKEVFEQNQEIGYTVEDKQFVVGSIPKEMQEVTPAVVPEHGPRNLPETTTKSTPQALSEIVADYAPRSLPEIFEKKGNRNLKVRKRRSSDLDNEIPTQDDEIDNRVHSISNKKVDSTTSTQATPSPKVTTETNSTTTISTNKPYSIINSIKNFLEVQFKIGLELLQSTTRAISRYLTEVQRRFSSKNNNPNGKEQPRKR